MPWHGTLSILEHAFYLSFAEPDAASACNLLTDESNNGTEGTMEEKEALMKQKEAHLEPLGCTGCRQLWWWGGGETSKGCRIALEKGDAVTQKGSSLLPI